MKKNVSQGTIIVLGIGILSFLSLFHLGMLDPQRLLLASKNLARFSGELFPPRMEILPALIRALGETIQISFTGTMLGFLMSLPLAFWGAHNLFSRPVTAAVRMIIGGVRTVPSVLFGVIFVIAFGLGPAAGTLGVAFYTVGYLAKLYYEAFEAVDPEVLEAVGSTGCSRLQLFRFAILPETANTIVSQLLFMFEYNIRASTIMGFVGAGGIGYYMVGYVQMLQYRNLSSALSLTFLVVMIIDYFSLKIRSLVAAPKN